MTGIRFLVQLCSNRFERPNLCCAVDSTALRNQHRRPVDFTFGDSAWLTLKGYNTDQPSKKLEHQRAGPFRIVEQVGHSFRLDLPPTMNIYPVISPDKPRKAVSDPVPGQLPDPPPPSIIRDEHEWEVEDVPTSRLSRGKLQYRVKWRGFDHDSTWYPASNFEGSPHLLRAFHRRYPDRPGLPASLDKWLIAWENGEELSYDNGGRPVAADSSTLAGVM